MKTMTILLLALLICLVQAKTITVECVQQDGLNDQTGPHSSIIRYDFPQRGDLGPVTFYWYDGSLFELIRLGRPDEPNWIGRLINPHITTRVSRILTGEATTGPYSPRLLDFLLNRALRDEGPRELRIR